MHDHLDSRSDDVHYAIHDCRVSLVRRKIHDRFMGLQLTAMVIMISLFEKFIPNQKRHL